MFGFKLRKEKDELFEEMVETLHHVEIVKTTKPSPQYIRALRERIKSQLIEADRILRIEHA